ncbi:DUF6678 family protein [Rhizobium leguminosarum]|nr:MULTISPECIES: DUF6678 family protein [Rhizobium]NKK00708.1 hypothetical protein [Rhizobium leguminosarum bv. viciae]MBA9031618.1 hypothetical protein [Rhizobium leguminosarum]MBP2486184.1 hypothetical protein [Rhizobium leguminosarum]NNU53964.1 hypothetical protein [Rhizobium indigoferae]TAY36242.1 hypothetical protein ELH89_03390 [Rhizobium leguminosarum]
MNDTKWRELCAGIRELPFPPAYQVKVLDENEPSPSTIERAPPYWGDWASTPEAALGVHVEWIRVTPRYKRHVARLLPPIIEDCSDQLRSLLRRLRIPFVESDGLFTIYGHASGIDFDTT